MQNEIAAMSSIGALGEAAARTQHVPSFERAGKSGDEVAADTRQIATESDTSAHFGLPKPPKESGDPRPDDAKPGDGLTPAQRLAVAALVCGRTISAAAVQAGVHRSTIHSWRKQTAFADAIEHYSREALEATAMRARSLMLKSTRTLAESLDETRRGESRFNWACRMVNSKHLWTLAQTMPTREDQE